MFKSEPDNYGGAVTTSTETGNCLVNPPTAAGRPICGSDETCVMWAIKEGS